MAPRRAQNPHLLYLDSSAIVKAFIAEEGATFVDHLMRRHRPVSTSQLSYLEVHSCFERLLREGGISPSGYASVDKQFDKAFSTYRRIELSMEILTLARTLAGRHPLRSLDAIQLASAVRLREAIAVSVIFAAADHRLLAAAKAEAFDVIDVAKGKTSEIL